MTDTMTRNIVNGLGINFADKDPRPEILGMLQSNEYVGTLEDATVANLRTVSGDGIFYIRSHGGMAKDVNGADVSYALWTSSEVLDPAIEAQDAKLSDDLAQLRVVYMRFRNDYDGLFTKADFSRHYGITKKFVAQYMSFPDDSLVYVDACNSSMDLTGDTNFRTAFKNASLLPQTKKTSRSFNFRSRRLGSRLMAMRIRSAAWSYSP